MISVFEAMAMKVLMLRKSGLAAFLGLSRQMVR
jgi:hypothetical protein